MQIVIKEYNIKVYCQKQIVYLSFFDDLKKKKKFSIERTPKLSAIVFT